MGKIKFIIVAIVTLIVFGASLNAAPHAYEDDYPIKKKESLDTTKKISNEEMMCIDGGFNPGVILPGVAAVWVCYEIGYAVGKAFVHATSR
jgi:hypothetical protein